MNILFKKLRPSVANLKISKSHCIALLSIIVLFTSFTDLQAQCSNLMPPVPGNQTKCSTGTYTLTATTYDAIVTSHRWYNSSGAQITPTRQYSGPSNSWISELTQTFSSTTSFTVEGLCSSGGTTPQTPVTFTLQISNVEITPSMPPPVCQGTNLSLTASGGSGYEWFFESVSSPRISEEAIIYPTQQGTYYLKGNNACGVSQTTSMYVGITPLVGTPSVPVGPASICKGTASSNYTSSASSSDWYSWTVTNALGSSVTNGTVTWDQNFSGVARVTVTAHGCNDSNQSSYLDVEVVSITKFNVGGGGSICSGSEGTITLSSSQSGVSYQLKRDDIFNVGTPKTGDGLPVYWPVTQEGTYKVEANKSPCAATLMNGSAQISFTQPAPIAITPSMPPPVCQGTSLSLTASGGSGYEWFFESLSSPVLSTATIIYPTQQGTYYLKGNNACGVSQTTSMYVGITPQVGIPSVPLGLTSICKGTASSNYTSSASNADWYSWTIANAAGSSITNGTVTWDENFSGIARITVTAHGCNNSNQSSFVDVEVVSITKFNLSGGGSICSGSETTITLNSSQSGVSYQLKRNDTFNVGSPRTGDGLPILWSVTEEGIYKVEATKSPCATTLMNGSAQVSYTIPPPVEITPSGTLPACEGTSVTLTASGGSDYKWYKDNTNTTPINTTSVLSVSEPGTYILTGNDNCGVLKTKTQVVDFFAPNVSITPSGAKTICSTCTETIYAVADNNYSYQWKKDGINISLAVSSSYPASGNGTYSVEVTFNNCKKTSPALNLTHNVLPVVNASPDQILELPANSLTINGSASDTDGSIASYLWTKTSGGEATLTGTTTSTLTASDLRFGAYTFKLEATDNFGETNYDELNISVNYPPNNYNYLKETIVLVPGKTLESEIQFLPIGEKAVGLKYFDGLGQSMQIIGVQSSPIKKDIVQPVSYDAFGREAVKYLPYVSGNDGWYKNEFISKENANYNSALNPQYQFYQSTQKVAVDIKPYAETLIETSPLNRVLKQGAPGEAWQPAGTDPMSLNDKTIKKRYESNEANEVYLFKYDLTTGLVSVDPNPALKFYGANKLYTNKTIDEHNNEVIEYSDKEGRTVCKKVQYGITGTPPAETKLYASTYYIYDDFGTLALVLPPEGVKEIMEIINQN